MSSENVGCDSQPVLHDLEQLLSKTMGDEVIVVNFTTTPLLPKGENYGSSMLKLDAVIRRTEDSAEEQLRLVAKMIPMSEYLQAHLNITITFARELFVYEKLASTYKELESEAGIEDATDLFSKCYGGRLTRNEEKDEADEDAVMLLENLKVRGYDVMDRKQGLDLDHTKSSIIQLARYHALGVAARRKKPHFYKEAERMMSVFPFDLPSSDYNEGVERSIKTICTDPRIAKFEHQIRASIEPDWNSHVTVELIEPWVTITHGDFWVNNIMFKQGSRKTDDLKFVDFQISRIGSPIQDLPHFLCTSTQPNVLNEHFDEMLNLYYVNFLELLTKLNCETSLFTKESFEKELKRIASRNLIHTLSALQFIILEVTENMDTNDMKTLLVSSGVSQSYLERSWNIVSKYVEKKWI